MKNNRFLVNYFPGNRIFLFLQLCLQGHAYQFLFETGYVNVKKYAQCSKKTFVWKTQILQYCKHKQISYSTAKYLFRN